MVTGWVGEDGLWGIQWRMETVEEKRYMLGGEEN